jgi:Zn-dependent protease/CBS domain-containing protein
MTNSWPIARIAGFEIRLHFSWIPILAFLTLSVLTEISGLDEQAAGPTAWATALIVSFGFLASVLIHELAHAIVARRRGVAGGPITLFFFGGTASAELESSRPEDEVRIAAAGPIASLVLALVLVGIAFAADGVGSEPFAIIASAALILGVLNALVGLINLVPGFPLDGGRVLRAIVWGRTHDERTGTRAAALAGRVAGWGMTLVGLGIALAGDGLDGVMLVIAGWFLGNAARAMDQRLAIEDLLAGAHVEEALERDVPRVAPQLTLDVFADQLKAAGATAIPVVRGDRLLGLIGLIQLRRVGRRAWATTRAEDAMVAVDRLPSLRPEDALWPAVEALRRSGLDGLPVIGDDGLLGVVTRRSVMAAIARHTRGAARTAA